MQIGSVVAGKYRIERLIGEGGMGTVVAATHLQLGTELALKFLNDQIKSSANSLERFTREARACAQLRSEHVCKVSDFGMAEGMPYLAMELLEGSDLSKVRANGPLDIPTAADYVLQACAGVAEAHAMGIVHRDLKPHNLFLAQRADGSPLIKVLDFGIAKIPLGDDVSITQTSSILGSPGYMAPEQLRSTKTVDARADVWALGVILYELTAGRHPFHAEAVTEIAVKIAMDDPPPLVEAPALQGIVSRCLEKDPEHRYPDVAALADDLAVLSGRRDLAETVRALLGGSAITGERRRSGRPSMAGRTSRSGGALGTDATVANLGTDATVANLGTDATVANLGTDATVANLGTDATIAAPADLAPGTTSSPARRRSRAILWGVLAVALLGGAAVVVALVLDRPSEPTSPPPTRTVAKTTKTPVREVAPPPRGSAAGSAAGSGSAPAPTPPPVELASLEIVVKGAYDPIVSVDGVVWGEGRKIARELPLGKHRIEIKVAGRPTITKDIELAGARSITIEVPHARHVAKTPPAGSGSGSGSSAPDPDQEAAKKKEELTARLLQTLRTVTIPQAVAATCLQLASVDRSVVPWEKCVAAQCSANPRIVMLMVSRAPIQQQHGLRELCPAAAPGYKP